MSAPLRTTSPVDLSRVSGFLFAFVACLSAMAELAARQTSPPKDWIEWQAKRRESVAGTNGWTTLVGRHWLREGMNFAGADPTNQAVLPAGRSPTSLGRFVRAGRSVRFEAAPGVEATINGKPVQTADLESDRDGNPTGDYVGPLSFVIIERGDRVGLRVRDPEAPARVHFSGLKYFPFDASWRLTGRFESFSRPRTMRVSDVTGGIQEYPSPGAVVFQRDGAEYRLDVAVEPDEDDYFVIFRDRTAGESTYESGRFLYVSRPGANGEVTIDFNRAYTPPCGFTAFATCPLPPSQNWLPFAIRAGELKPETHP
ncbi:MAG TPA: DUF1684 domain-containing protein [Verrucomicrobiota bacterium]|nr:DUF1684 domain-containing protein [Verrucomicrobiota bacterium]